MKEKVMPQIAYLLLAHEAPERVAQMAQALARAGADVVIHYDRKSRGFDQLTTLVKDAPRIHLMHGRVRCHWGDWSLVKATRALVRYGLQHLPKATHFHLISGACCPIMPYAQIQQILAEHDQDFIETAMFDAGTWVQSGDQLSRARHLHLFPERWWKRGFTWLDDLQRLLGVHRTAPQGMTLHIGSQWWCLRRSTLEQTEALWAQRPDLERFFKYCWIPDEITYQTLVAHLVPQEQRHDRSPTLSAFSEHGQPFEFFLDHKEVLLECDQFFARKIAPSAQTLQHDFLQAFLSDQITPRHIQGDAFLALKLRDLARIQDTLYPFWMDTNTPLEPLTLRVIICHTEALGEEIAQRIAASLDMPSLGYPWSNRPYDSAPLSEWREDPKMRRAHWSELIERSCAALNTAQAVVCLNRGDTRLLSWLAQRYSIQVLWLKNDADADQLLDERAVSRAPHSPQAKALARDTLAAYDAAIEALSTLQMTAPHICGWAPALRAFGCPDPFPNTHAFEETSP